MKMKALLTLLKKRYILLVVPLYSLVVPQRLLTPLKKRFPLPLNTYWCHSLVVPQRLLADAAHHLLPACIHAKKPAHPTHPTPLCINTYWCHSLVVPQRLLVDAARVAQHVLGQVLHRVDGEAPAGQGQPLHVAALWFGCTGCVCVCRCEGWEGPHIHPSIPHSIHPPPSIPIHPSLHPPTPTHPPTHPHTSLHPSTHSPWPGAAR